MKGPISINEIKSQYEYRMKQALASWDEETKYEPRPLTTFEFCRYLIMDPIKIRDGLILFY